MPHPLVVDTSDGSRPTQAPEGDGVCDNTASVNNLSVQISAHLSAVAAAPLTCERLKTRHDSYTSFYVAIDDACFERLRNLALWPQHCLFKTFRGELTVMTESN